MLIPFWVKVIDIMCDLIRIVPEEDTIEVKNMLYK